MVAGGNGMPSKFIRIVSIAFIVGAIVHTASAQDCERFAFACQGWNGTRSSPSTSDQPLRPTEPLLDPGTQRSYAAIYGSVGGEPHPIPALSLSEVDPAFLRKTVHYPTSEPVGTIIIDPANHYLYLVQEGGRALRYG